MTRNNEHVPVDTAAEMMGKTPQFVRIGLQRQLLPIGAAVQMPGGRWSYYISPRRLEMYLSGGDMVADHDDARRVQGSDAS